MNGMRKRYFGGNALAAIAAISLAGWTGGSALIPVVRAADSDAVTEARREAEQAEGRMNALVEVVRKALPDAHFRELRFDQERWLEHRAAAAEWNAALGGAGDRGAAATSSASYWKTMTRLTEERLRMLDAWKAAKPGENWDGVWEDGYGGVLKLAKEGDALHFSIEVVRGASEHRGSIRGRAELNRTLARYSDRDQDPAKAKDFGETWIALARTGIVVEVNGANTMFYHGAHAYFDGAYLRTGDLPAADRKALLEATAVKPAS